MKRIASLLAVLAALVGVAWVHAGLVVTRAQAVLELAPDSRTMRLELARVADSLRTADPAASGEAFYWLGICEREAGLADRSIEDLRRAVELRNAPEESIALIDALTARSAPRDHDEAEKRLHDLDAQGGIPELRLAVQARLGWLKFAEGRVDSAARVFESMRNAVEGDPTWRERAGLALAAGKKGDAGEAFALLHPIAVDSRGADRQAVNALRAALASDPKRSLLDLDRVLRGAIVRSVSDEDRVIAALGGRRFQANASDGAPISAVSFADARRLPLLVTLMAPGDSIAGYDSLVVTLRRAGLALLLVERRGTRGAATPDCRLPLDTFGREQAMDQRIARDAIEALRAAARSARLDTSRVLFGGVRGAASTAILAAQQYGRTTALVLVSPDVSPTTLGPTRARIAALSRPLYLQLSGEDYDLTRIADALYQSGLRGASFIAESHAPGRGAAQFRTDPRLEPRFERWLGDALKIPPPRATPRSARRRG